MRFLDDRRLYADTGHCLDHLRSIPTAPPTAPGAGPMPVHVYWRGAIGPIQALCLKSFLATQDPVRVRLWLWLDAGDGFRGHERNPHLAPLLPHITVKRFRATAEAAGSPLDPMRPRKPLDWLKHFRFIAVARRAVGHSNTVRFMLLYRYGGLYFDVDVLFLRDLGDLMAHLPTREFCYQWSDRPFANSAAFALDGASPTATYLLEEGARERKCGPRARLQFDDPGIDDLLCLPQAYFDPLWLHNDGREDDTSHYFDAFPEFFQPREPDCSMADFYRGAFAYHWHNCWNATPVARSYAGRFNAEIDDALRTRYGIEPYPAFTARDPVPA